MQPQSVETDGVKLTYVEQGSGKPVVFVHGIPTDYRAWNNQAEQFSRQFRFISYSRRYAHPNQRTGDLLDSTVENNTIDLTGLIRNLGLEPVNLVGHSYGGFIAAYFALLNPGLVRRMVLVEPGVSTLLVNNPNSPTELLGLLLRSPSVALSAARFRSRALNPLLEAFKMGDQERALRLFLDGIQESQGALDALPEAVRQMVKQNARTVGELAAKLPSFTREDAKRIATPTLLVNGSESPKFLHGIARILASSMPRSSSVVVGGSAHFPHFENAAEFNSRVIDFLSA